jgi:hypothetical protein
MHGIALCIQNDFSNFIDLNYLVMKGTSNNFPHIEDDWPNCFENNNNEEFINNCKMIKMKHKIYNFEFKHDFKPNINFEDIKEKYDRRIKRFYNVMRSDDTKILLIMNKKKYYYEVKNLMIIFHAKGFINYKIKFISDEDLPKTESWHRNEFNWFKWINED